MKGAVTVGCFLHWAFELLLVLPSWMLCCTPISLVPLACLPLPPGLRYWLVMAELTECHLHWKIELACGLTEFVLLVATLKVGPG